MMDRSTVPDGAIGIVSPRYGPGVIGGAEAVLADMARGLAKRGQQVEILTTCARDHFTWANEFPPSAFDDAGVTIRRFPTQTDSPGAARDALGARILSGERITIQDQQLWANDSLRCSGLWNHVFDQGERYRWLIFGPYLFWTTYAVSQLYPDRSLIMPCLHDEPMARMEIFSSMLEGVAGLLFLTEPERELANSLYRLGDRQAVIGAGVDAPSGYDPSAFRDEFDLEGPYLYYAGRREWGKGWESLRRAYGRYARERVGPGRLRLVTSGVGEVEPLLGASGDLVDVGLLTSEQRDNAMAGAVAYVQPSAMESFSLTVLEAMLAGTPVIANAASSVVDWHLQRSNAGLTYRTEHELAQTFHFASDEPAALRELATSGRDYVLEHYNPVGVIDRLVEVLDRWDDARLQTTGAGATASKVSVS